ncbi:MAG: polysaccharide biosynthesis protein, partial [Pseudomonadota bacterium]
SIAAVATECGVERVVALSTDKAANPVNLYGASKLASDKIMVAANILSGGKTKYGVVRYGNVLGSRGSVIPFFRRILADGADHIPITDPRMTRFFISLQQGVDFVMTAINGLQGGEIVVPKVPSVRITDLATALAPQLEQRVVGIRPGEKIHETLVSIDDGRATVELDGYFVIKPSFFELQSDFYKEKNAKPVGDDFYYASDNNAFWLKVNEIEDLINELGL